MAAKYKTDPASIISDMPDLPDNLSGLLHVVQGVTEKPATETEPKEKTSKAHTKKETSRTVPASLTGKDLWEQFTNLCEEGSNIPKTIGTGGNSRMVIVENDIVDTLQMYHVNGHNISTMANAILRTFLLHYKEKFLKYSTKQNSTTIF